MIVVVTLRPFGLFAGTSISETTLIALLVALIPTTIGALLSAIGIAGMDRLVRRNVLALSGRAVEASGDVDVLLLDKTGTITIGNRLASEFVPMPGVPEAELAEAAQLSSLADETPEGRSIVVLAKQYGIREHDMATLHAEFVPFTAQTRMSGVDIDGQPAAQGRRRRDHRSWSRAKAARRRRSCRPQLDRIGREGGTPLAVSRDSQVLGVVYLKDTVKEGMKARFDQLRAMGIKTIMVTGDNRLTAAKIAEESGVDDFLAEATPERKLALIKEQQEDGRLVAMTGDGTNDAPALAQADVGVAMNTGTQAAREAGNMVDLDSNPTKLIEIVEVGKQLLITRGALTTFSIANDVAKYFAILPAIFITTYATSPGGKGPLHVLNIMDLGTPESAIVSAIIFNAIVIPMLIPLSLRGVRYRPIGASALLRRNLWIYGLGGIIAPFIGIKLIDLVVHNLLGAEGRTSPCEHPTGSGSLKVFIGMAAGVGKTYRMLLEGEAEQRAGRDVVIGLLETHGRAETAAWPRISSCRARRRRLSRHDDAGDGSPGDPAPRAGAVPDRRAGPLQCAGQRAPKRYEDVEQVLAAGIDVLSTLNVQHLESLNDHITELSGIRVRETIPDAILGHADEVVLIDLSPEALLDRLRAGKVYPPERIDAALNNFFRIENLSALREVALRLLAEEVGAKRLTTELTGSREESLAHDAPQAVGERLLALVEPYPRAQRLVRRAWRSAQRLGAELDLLWVRPPGRDLSADEERSLAALGQLASVLGARMIEEESDELATAIKEVAERRGTTYILLGHEPPGRAAWRGCARHCPSA